MPERPVPALPSLQGIPDQNTREALRHVYDLLNVRNGDVGDGRDAFVTRKELADNGGIIVGGFGGRSPLPGGLQAQNVSNWAAEQSRVLSDLENAVRSSPFFNYLQTPIKRLAQEGAQIKTEQTTLQTSFASLARINSVMQAQISSSYALLEETRQVTADLDGRLSAQWSVKIDINGYVSGFGLSSTANNSTPFSEFYIAADRFAIGSPGVPRTITGGQYDSPTAANVPFIVVTTPQVLNGKTVPPGVYMRDAFIQNGSIVRARIGTAQIDTLEVAGNAITVPVAANQGSNFLITTSNQSVASISIFYDSALPVPAFTFVLGFVTCTPAGGTVNYDIYGEIFVNGTSYMSWYQSVTGGFSGALSISQAIPSSWIGAGTTTVEFFVRSPQNPSNVTVSKGTLIAIGAKR